MAAYSTDTEPFELDDYSRYRLKQNHAAIPIDEQDSIVSDRWKQLRNALPSLEQVRNFILDNLTTQNSPLEWMAQQAFPDYRSSNTAGIYADNPDWEGMAMNFAGARGKGPKDRHFANLLRRAEQAGNTREAELLRDAARLKQENMDYPVQAAFKTPSGVIPTGAIHDLDALPPSLQDTDLISGFTDANKFWPKNDKGIIDPNVFESYRKPLGIYNEPPMLGERYPNPANDPIYGTPGPEVVGRVNSGGGLHFKNERYFSRPLEEEMPTSGLPDDIDPDALEAFKKKWLDPKQVDLNPPYNPLADPSLLEADREWWQTRGPVQPYELPPNFANDVLPPEPPTPLFPGGRKKKK